MTVPPAWPEANEDSYSGGPGRSELVKDIKDRLQEAKDQWDAKGTGAFAPATWSGSASDAAKAWVTGHSGDMESMKALLDKAKAFYDQTHSTIVNAKEQIRDNCEKAQKKIEALIEAADENTKPSDLENAIQDVINKVVEANAAVVNAAADAVRKGDLYEAPKDVATHKGDGAQLLSGEVPGAPTPLSNQLNPTNEGNQPAQGPPQPTKPPALSNQLNPTNEGNQPAQGPPQPTKPPALSNQLNPTNEGNQPAQGPPQPTKPPALSNQINPTNEGNQPAQGPPSPGVPLSPTPTSTAGTPSPPSVGSPGTPSSGSGGTPGISSGSGGGQPSSPSSQMSAADGKGGDGKAGAQADNAQAGPGKAGMGQTPNDLAKIAAQTVATAQQGISPASASALQALTPHLPPVDPPAVTTQQSGSVPDTGSGPGPGAGSMPTGGGGGSVAPPSGGGMPAMPPMPLGPPSTPSPAGPLPPAAPTGPSVNPASTLKPDILAAPIPVSVARAERDAILAASTAGAMAAGAGNTNAALVRARHIGAALNVGASDFGFFWVTALTADGTIVVANSYGLGYIPDGVHLPDNVKMATADESIPLADRAKWVTYPILAVQGWSQAHDQKLRTVIATEAQFANFDPGTAKTVLQPEDIPDSGIMQGRNRLAVIAPAAAAQLAAIGPAALNDVLPAPPTDTAAPEDNSVAMWFDVAVPLMSTAPDRGIAHMQQFVQYAEHAQELALYRAHTAADGVMQRTAIADWIYWQHLSVLMSDAIGATANV